MADIGYTTGPNIRALPAEMQDGPEPMGEEQFAAAVKSAIDDAADYIDGYIQETRNQATKFYRGDPFGNEEVGRSQFVMTEVRDVVLAQMPSLLRIFTSSTEAASFEPRTAQKVEMAEQATDAVNYVFYNDNDGFSILYNAFKDALVRKSGVLKWRWDEDIEIIEYDFTGLSDAQMQQLHGDPDVDIIDDRSYPQPGWQPPPMLPPQMMMPPQQGLLMGPGGPPPGMGAPPPAPSAAGMPMPPGPMPGGPPPGAPPAGLMAPGMPPGMPPGPPMPMAVPQPPTLHDVHIRRRKNKSRALVECVPPEEMLVSRTSRDLKTSPMIGHRSIKTYSDLVKMGYDLDQIKEVSGLGDSFLTNAEAQTRNPAINAFQQSPDINDESSTKVTYVEAFIRIDKDGDGIADCVASA